jgi:hypothetical protein
VRKATNMGVSGCGMIRTALVILAWVGAATCAVAQCAVPSPPTTAPIATPPTNSGPFPGSLQPTPTLDLSNPISPVPDLSNPVAPLLGDMTCGSPPPPPPPVNGVCGSSDGIPVSSAPTTGLCNAGNASLVSGSGPWSWTCAGTNGGTTAICSAPVVPPPPIDGVCGSADGVAVSSAPTSNLCSVGTATAVLGTGPWNWNCNGSDGGANAACVAPLAPPPPPGTETMGETTAFGTIDSGNRGLLLAQDAQLAIDGTLHSLSFYVAAEVGDLRLGLYDAMGPGGGPGNLIVQTGSFRPVVGWNTRTVTAKTLAAGSYWLAYTPARNGLTVSVEHDYGNCWWTNRSFEAMPAQFPAIVGMDMCHFSFYATLMTQ